MAQRSEKLARLSALGASTGRRVAARVSVRDRFVRLRVRGWFIVQCAVSAAVAWWIAAEALGQPSPFFAPVAALVCLGMSYGQRLRRTVEIVVGVAVGVAVADLVVRVVGVGTWQIVLTVAVALALATFLSGGSLIVTQAGVQAVIVTTLIPDPDAGFSRWIDALIGGAVALIAATLVPTSPLRRPREETAAVIEEIADLLAEVADSARTGSPERCAATLARARRSEPALEALREATLEALAVAQLSPWRRRHLEALRGVAAMAEPIDHAVRNLRVLVRRALAATRSGDRLPADVVGVIAELAAATAALAAVVAHRRPLEDAIPALVEVGRRSGTIIAPTGISAQVVLGQLRSIVVDLLETTGRTYAEATALLPRQ